MTLDMQISDLFKKLDTDGSNGLDMEEMKELLNNNDMFMTSKQVTQMFSDCQSVLKNAGGKKSNVDLDSKSKLNYGLELRLEDFKAITTEPLALNKLRAHLTAFKKEKNRKVPVTIDALFHSFLIKLTRQDCLNSIEANSSVFL